MIELKSGFVLSIIILLMTCSCSNSRKQNGNPSKNPNIIFIISDDQGYADYSFMGHEQIETPNLDRLASESLTFTKGYVTAPLCSPSLASIITGQYAHQHGITGNDPKVDFEGPKGISLLSSNDTFPTNSYPVQRDKAYQKLASNFYKNRLITQTLSDNGYLSFQSGKWWVGSAEDAGFDKGMTHGDFMRGGRHGDEGLKIGREGLDPVYNFIKEADSLDKPFFIWYAPFLPHTPHNPPKDLEEKYLKRTQNPFVAKYWAMVEWFDQTTGQLLDFLETNGLDENTIIVYTCDNGWIQSGKRNGYAPKSKRAPHESGIRTPMMFRYPNVIKPETNVESLVSNIDIVPTIHALLGLDAGHLPGINVLNEKDLRSRKTLFAEAYNHDILNVDNPTESILYKVAVEDKWKLILPNKRMVSKDAVTEKDSTAGFYSKDVQLYNLIEDPAELVNKADTYPQEVTRLSQAIQEWWKTN